MDKLIPMLNPISDKTKNGPKTSVKPLTASQLGLITSFPLFAVKVSRLSLAYPGNIKIASIQTGNQNINPSVVFKLSRFRQAFAYILLFKYMHGLFMNLRGSPFNYQKASTALEKFTQTSYILLWTFGLFIPVFAFSQIHRLERVINEISGIERKIAELGVRPINWFLAYLIPRILGATFIAANLAPVFCDDNIFGRVSFDWQKLVSILATKTDGQYLVGNLTDFEIETYNLGNTTTETIFKISFGTFAMAAHIFACYVEFFGNALACATVFSTCLLVYMFRRGLQDRKLEVPLGKVLEIAEDLLDLFDYIEDAIGWIIFYLCFACVSYFATRMEDVVYGTRWESITFVAYSSIFLITNISAALCNRWFKYLATWYRKELGKPSELLWTSTAKSAFGSRIVCTQERRFDVLMQEMSIREIGIRGKLFTSNFSFFGQVCGLVITYAVLWYQLKT